jgi:hypothetical protein
MIRKNNIIWFLWRQFALAAAASVVLANSTAASPSVFPTGTTRYDPAKAYNSFVLFTGGDDVTRLIDLDGNVVREWNYRGFPPVFLDPALIGGQRGHVVVTLETVEGTGTDLVPGRVSPRIAKTIGEVDWDGKIHWTFGDQAPGGRAQQHHDVVRLPNGNTIVLANITHPVVGFEQPLVLDDVVYEVDPKGAVVWTWTASEHLAELGFTSEELQLLRASKSADYLHVNNLKPIGPNRWFDTGDERFHPDNLIFDSRQGNFIAIIERKTGKIVWTLGPHFPAITETGAATSRAVPRPVDQISGQHDAHLIPTGLPGAGNLLVFDNQGEGGYPPAALTVTGGSRVLEIDPIRKEIVWQYIGPDSGDPGWTFKSTHISNARRLPNGNTLIVEGQYGRFFQVTPKGEIVWEYINPFPRRLTANGRADVNYQVYRAQPVPYEWAPAGTPHSERPVTPPDNTTFRIWATIN